MKLYVPMNILMLFCLKFKPKNCFKVGLKTLTWFRCTVELGHIKVFKLIFILFLPKKIGNTSAQNNFGPENTSAHLYTSARRILRPTYILWPGNNFGPENTLARKYFGPIDFGPRTKLSKVSFFIIFDLP